MAEGGNRGSRELRVGTRGSSDRSSRKLRVWSPRRSRVWASKGFKKERRFERSHVRDVGSGVLQRRGALEGKSEGVQSRGIQGDTVASLEETQIGGTRVLRMGHLKGLEAEGGSIRTLNVVREWGLW